MADAIPFQAPALSPLRAHLHNVLGTRERPWTVRVADRECLLDLAELPSPPACVFEIRCGDRLWRLEAGNVELIRLHPALAAVDADAELPSGLVQALLELLAAPALAAAQSLLDMPLELAGCRLADPGDAGEHPEKKPGEASGTAADLLLRVPLSSAEAALFGERAVAARPSGSKGSPADSPAASPADSPAPQEAQAVSEDAAAGAGARLPEGADAASEADGAFWLPVPLRLVVPDRESALALIERLGTLPPRRTPRPDLPVAVVIEAGRMALTVRELSGLEAGDVLLPGSYPAADGNVTLSVGGVSWLCALSGRTAVVSSLLNPAAPQEVPMSEQNAEAAAPGGVAVGELELPVVFELERRLLAVRDVEALAPGYTFALGCDALAPVTLTVNGRAVARGRLVDLNGTLGVQLTETEIVADEAGGRE